MHVLVLATHTPDCAKVWLSLQAAGHDTSTIVYDAMNHDHHAEIIEQAKQLRPRLRGIVFIGALAQYHTKPVPKPEMLKRLREVAPSVHLCFDGGESVWWEQLYRYDRDEVFDAQVSTDGVTESPISKMRRGVVLCPPVDPRPFVVKPYEERARIAGMSGAREHGEREQLISMLTRRCGLPYKEREGSYEDMAKFLCDCKVVISCPQSGSGKVDQVKARVLEAGLAGACLLERKNKVIEQWFDGHEYVTYTDVEDCIAKIQWTRDHPEEAKLLGEKMRVAVANRHHPDRFWAKVFETAKMREEV